MQERITGKLVNLTEDSWCLHDILPPVFEKQLSDKGYSEFLFYSKKYFPGLPRQKNPDFILNQGHSGYILLVSSSFGRIIHDQDPLATVLGLVDSGIKVLISTESLDAKFSKAAFDKGILIMIVKHLVFEKLRTYHSSWIHIDCERFLMKIEEYSFDFLLDPQMSLNTQCGMNQIDYTLTFRNEILRYEIESTTFNN